MLDFLSNDLIYIIPTGTEKPIKVIFENSFDKEKELDCNHIIKIDLSGDADIAKWVEVIEKVSPSNS